MNLYRFFWDLLVFNKTQPVKLLSLLWTYTKLLLEHWVHLRSVFYVPWWTSPTSTLGQIQLSDCDGYGSLGCCLLGYVLVKQTILVIQSGGERMVLPFMCLQHRIYLFFSVSMCFCTHKLTPFRTWDVQPTSETSLHKLHQFLLSSRLDIYWNNS